MDNKKFNEVINILPENIKNVLIYVSDNIKINTYEIRLRKNKPVVLYGSFGSNFVKTDATVSGIDCRHALTVTENDLRETVSSICGYSVYSHQNDIAQGFVTFGNGHRAGFCGTAVISDNSITALRDIDSVNIRISCEVDDAADEILSGIVSNNSFNGIIVAGGPCTGKTTVLKSFAAKISSLYEFGYMKTVLIDERYEMGSSNGINCDVLRGFSKTDGITHAIRVLSPEIIICDEVTTLEEAEKIIRGCYTGVKFVISVHIGIQDDLFKRSVSRKLTDSGFFDYTVFLDNHTLPGNIKQIAKTEDLKNEYTCNNRSNGKFIYNGIPCYT